jgi:hypothetical protein
LDRPRWWIQILLVVAFAWAYDAVRALHGNVVSQAVRHGRDVLSVDRWLHVDWSAPMNHWVSHYDWLSDVLAGYYVVMHLGMVALTLLVLWVAGRGYTFHRNVLILLSLVGMAVYWLYPVAPPRLLDPHVHDTVQTALPFAYNVESKSANLYAAVPSLHMAWAVWVTVALWAVSRRWWVRLLAGLHPVLTGITVLATGNHYTFDLLTGIALTSVGYLVAYPARQLLPLRRVPIQISRRSGRELALQRSDR